MNKRIGLLLPRSTDYPSLGFDLMDGLKGQLKHTGQTGVQFVSENIGYGDDHALNYARAEKMILQDEVDLIIAYSDTSNAEYLYDLADTTRCPVLFANAGMRLPQRDPSPFAYHISLQGLHACRIAGEMAAGKGKKILFATSFYDGGYSGPLSYSQGLTAAGGSVCGNYVSGYKVSEFSIANYLSLLQSSGAESVAACFSSYLAALFMGALKAEKDKAIPLPFYCSPFMAEEQLLSQLDFPGGIFYTVVPWSSDLDNHSQRGFKSAVKALKGKEANIFHLLGWEAGILSQQVFNHGMSSLNDFIYDSPRGRTTVHSATHHTYANLYGGRIVSGDNAKCLLVTDSTIPVAHNDHKLVLNDKPEDRISSGWRNNYFCC